MRIDVMDKVALVTGGSRGLGEAIVRGLADQGAKVMIADVLDGTALASALGDTVASTHVDVTDEKAWQRAIAETEDLFGPVTTLVNNAGINHNEPMETLAEADYRRVIDVNQVGVFLGMKSVIGSMRRAGSGSIVNISSIGGINAFADVMGYVASKWAVRGMSKAAAQELGRYRIRVNSVHPGIIMTPMTEGTNSAELTEALPLGHPGVPEDIAAMVLFLASDAAAYCTGCEYVVDGGFTSM